jgi:hypothetical protein
VWQWYRCLWWLWVFKRKIVLLHFTKHESSDVLDPWRGATAAPCSFWVWLFSLWIFNFMPMTCKVVVAGQPSKPFILHLRVWSSFICFFLSDRCLSALPSTTIPPNKLKGWDWEALCGRCAAWALWIGDVSRQNQNIYISHWLEFILVPSAPNDAIFTPKVCTSNDHPPSTMMAKIYDGNFNFVNTQIFVHPSSQQWTDRSRDASPSPWVVSVRRKAIEEGGRISIHGFDSLVCFFCKCISLLSIPSDCWIYFSYGHRFVQLQLPHLITWEAS